MSCLAGLAAALLMAGAGAAPPPSAEIIPALRIFDEVSALAVSDARGLVAVASKANTVGIIDYATQRPLFDIDLENEFCSRLRFSGDARELHCGTSQGSLIRFDATSGRPLSRVKHLSGAVTVLQPTADGRRWLIAGSDGKSMVLDAKGAVLTTAVGGSFVTTGDISPSGTRFATVDWDGRLYVHRVAPGAAALVTPGDLGSGVLALDFHDDDSAWISYRDGSRQRINLDSGELLQESAGKTRYVQNPDGTLAGFPVTRIDRRLLVGRAALDTKLPIFEIGESGRLSAAYLRLPAGDAVDIMAAGAGPLRLRGTRQGAQALLKGRHLILAADGSLRTAERMSAGAVPGLRGRWRGIAASPGGSRAIGIDDQGTVLSLGDQPLPHRPALPASLLAKSPIIRVLACSDTHPVCAGLAMQPDGIGADTAFRIDLAGGRVDVMPAAPGSDLMQDLLLAGDQLVITAAGGRLLNWDGSAPPRSRVIHTQDLRGIAAGRRPGEALIGTRTGEVLEVAISQGAARPWIKAPDASGRAAICGTQGCGWMEYGDAGATAIAHHEGQTWIGRWNGSLERYGPGGELLASQRLLAPVSQITIAPDRGYLSVRELSGRIKLIDLGSNRIRATLASNAHGSGTFTPEGYFDGDSDFVRTSTVSAGGAVHPLEAFYDVLYRPDLVAASLAGLELGPRVGGLTVEAALKQPAPAVTLGPLPQATDARQVVVPYAVHDRGGGIGEIRIIHNGKLVQSDGHYRDAPGSALIPFADGTRASSPLSRLAAPLGIARREQMVVRQGAAKSCNPCTGEVRIELLPGETNSVSVLAFNRENTLQSLPGHARIQSTLPRAEPSLWVLGVGIDRYRNAGRLMNARKDAIDFACAHAGRQALMKTGQACGATGQASGPFKPDRIHVVDLLLDERATRDAMLQALARVAAAAAPQDTFVWFVASHGMLDANGLYGIVPHDAACTPSGATGRNCTGLAGLLTSNDILNASRNIKALRQLIVLDTCYSGGVDRLLSGLYDSRMSLLAKNMGLHLFASAQASELALDGEPGTNGLFTGQLLQGLRGKAAPAPGGWITARTLGAFARDQTMALSAGEGGPAPEQTPVIQHFGIDAPLAVGRGQ